jgi:hypothetical protein
MVADHNGGYKNVVGVAAKLNGKLEASFNHLVELCLNKGDEAAMETP